jgi:hypothetical protein
MKKAFCAVAVILLCLGLLIFSVADINHGHGPGGEHGGGHNSEHSEEGESIVRTSH